MYTGLYRTVQDCAGLYTGLCRTVQDCTEVLPCTHWSWSLALRAVLELEEASSDAGDTPACIQVQLHDQIGSFCGICPKDLVEGNSTAVRARLQLILQSLGIAPPKQNSAALMWNKHYRLEDTQTIQSFQTGEALTTVTEEAEVEGAVEVEQSASVIMFPTAPSTPDWV